MRCHDGRTEIATNEQVQNGQICVPGSQPTDVPSSTGEYDPFAPNACPPGPGWDVASVEAKLSPGTLSTSFGANLYARFAAADCALRSDGSTTCGPWKDLPVAKLRNAWVTLTADPVKHTADATIRAFERGTLSHTYYSCWGESGDLCPTNYSSELVMFGVEFKSDMLTGFADGFERAPASILLGQAARTANDPPDRSVDGQSVKAYYLGSYASYPGEFLEALQYRMASAIPDGNKDIAAQRARITTSCALAYLRSAPPPPNTPSWKVTVGGVLVRY